MTISEFIDIFKKDILFETEFQSRGRCFIAALLQPDLVLVAIVLYSYDPGTSVIDCESIAGRLRDQGSVLTHCSDFWTGTSVRRTRNLQRL